MKEVVLIFLALFTAPKNKANNTHTLPKVFFEAATDALQVQKKKASLLAIFECVIIECTSHQCVRTQKDILLPTGFYIPPIDREFTNNRLKNRVHEPLTNFKLQVNKRVKTQHTGFAFNYRGPPYKCIF